MKFSARLQRILMIMLALQLILPIGLVNRVSVIAAPPARPQHQRVEITPQLVSGLKEKVDVVEDEFGISHIFAKRVEDVYFMQGMLHARDRFFQMDTTRRTADGTLAELIGAGPDNSVIDMDVQLRGLNLTKAVTDALPMMSKDTRKILKAYTKGVNAYLNANPLPAEYQALHITQKRLWTDLDTLLIGKALALSLSFDTGDIDRTLALKAYEAAGTAQGFDGTALFFEDVNRVAPFDATFAIPDASGQPVSADQSRAAAQATKLRVEQQHQWSQNLTKIIKPATLDLARNYLDKIRNVPLLSKGSDFDNKNRGSNWFILSGKLTDTGVPLVNNDPHLAFSTPPIWYQIQLNVAGKGKGEPLLNVTGVSLAGVPGVVLGHNDHVAWAVTTSNFDVTDVYQEQIVAEFGKISIVHDGQKETVEFRNETFRANKLSGNNDDIQVVTGSDIPPRFPSVARRNNGPLVGVDVANQTAISLQYTGFGPTFEVETFFGINTAKNLDDFRKALDFFDVGSQNFAVATDTGDIAYFTTGEVPLREDLEAGKVTGAPPFFIRDGRSGNEWLPLKQRQPNQTLNYEILPFAELPQIENPTRGFVVTANNDMVGLTANNNPLEKKRASGGIYYLGSDFSNGSRAARLTGDIEAAVTAGQKITVEMARHFQASVRMRDAEVFMPFIQQAFANAQQQNAPSELVALANDPAIKEAVTRFKTWDFSTPTGLRNGYDAFVPYNQADPTDAQIAASVSTTIYSLWRSQFVRNTIDNTLTSRQLPTPPGQLALSALRHLLDNFSTNKGLGASGLPFLQTASLSTATPEAQRDFLILKSLRDALTTLSGPDFTLAFQGSTNQQDYRWGYLHRAFFPNQVGRESEFSIPSVNGNFPSPLPGLFGLPRDGGIEVPNASNHNVRASAVNDFMFSGGPSKRQTIVVKPNAISTVIAIPGGQSGSLTSKFHDNLLKFWLVADVYPLVTMKPQTAAPNAQHFVYQPAK